MHVAQLGSHRSIQSPRQIQGTVWRWSGHLVHQRSDVEWTGFRQHGLFQWIGNNSGHLQQPQRSS